MIRAIKRKEKWELKQIYCVYLVYISAVVQGPAIMYVKSRYISQNHKSFRETESKT